MKVRAQFFSRLKDLMGAEELEVELRDGATISELLEVLFQRAPKLREWDNSILIGLGMEFVGRDHVLRSGDSVAIMPPVQGG